MFKNLFIGIGMLAAVTLLVAGCTDSGLVDNDTTSANIAKDSDAPGVIGFDYKWNIIGVPQDKSAEMDGNNGKRMFVQLEGGQTVCDPDITDNKDPLYCKPGDLHGGGSVDGGWDTQDYTKHNKILLTPCDPLDADCDFQIVDANATDADGAEMIVPDDLSSEYEFYVRALGKPGGSARVTTCADELYDEATYETWCSSTSAVLTRDKGKPKTENVTAELLFMDISVDTATDSLLADCLYDGVAPDDQVVDFDDIPLFDACFENYFWNYDNNGLKLLQAWFKKKPTV
jgi:hypothetical protein